MYHGSCEISTEDSRAVLKTSIRFLLGAGNSGTLAVFV